MLCTGGHVVLLMLFKLQGHKDSIKYQSGISEIRVCGDLQGTVLWLCSALRWVGLCCSCLLTLALCLYHIALRFLLRRLSLASCAAAPLLLQGRVVAGKGKQNMHRLQFLGPRETPFPSPAAESCHTHRLSTDLAQSSIRH